MSRVSALLCACAVIGSLAVLELAFGASGPSSAGPGDISFVAIDMDTAGNNTASCAGQGCQPGTLGAIQTCGEIDAVGGTLDVDIVVDSIPNAIGGSGAGPNIQGYDMDLIYDPGIVEVTALPANAGVGGPPGNLNVNYAGTPGGAHASTGEIPPDSDGNFFMSEIDFGVVGESGPGILMRLTLRGVANGTSQLKIQYTLLNQPNPQIYDNTGGQGVYTIDKNEPSAVVVGGTGCGTGEGDSTPVSGGGEPTPRASQFVTDTPSGTPNAVESNRPDGSSSNEETSSDAPSNGNGPTQTSNGGSGSKSLILIGGAIAVLCVAAGATFLIMRRARKL